MLFLELTFDVDEKHYFFDGIQLMQNLCSHVLLIKIDVQCHKNGQKRASLKSA